MVYFSLNWIVIGKTCYILLLLDQTVVWNGHTLHAFQSIMWKLVWNTRKHCYYLPNWVDFLTIIPAKTVEVVAVHCYRSQHWLDSQAENISAFSALDGLLHFDRALYAIALSEVNSAKSWSTEDTIQQLIQLIFFLFCYVGGIWIQIVQKLICLYFNSSGKITSQHRGCLYL